ncbi:amine oxidase, partial [Ostertagia ostertagi]
MITTRRIAERRPSRMPELPRQVAIIGAGFAGLSAAAVLERKHIDYVVYEGSNRVGGRVYSVPYEDGWLQHGAEFINGENNEIFRIANEKQLTVQYVRDFDLFCTNVVYGLNGKKLDNINVGVSITKPCLISSFKFSGVQFKHDWLDFVKDIEEQFAAEALERSDMSVAERFQELYEQWISVRDEFKDHRAVFDRLARLYLTYYEIEWSSPANELALLNFADWDDGGSEPRSFTLKKKGFRDILEDIKIKVPENRIKLNSVVTKIKYAGFGNMMKVFLEYTRPWWPQDANAIAPLESHSPLAESFPMLQPLYWNKKILVAWVSGKGPQLISKLSDEELVEGLTHHLREALGDPTIPLPVKIYRHSWITDPLVGGSYSYLTPDSVKYVPDAFVRMAEPIIIED